MNNSFSLFHLKDIGLNWDKYVQSISKVDSPISNCGTMQLFGGFATNTIGSIINYSQ